MAGGHSHPNENNPTQQPLRSLPTNLLMGSLKNHLMADGTIGNLTVTGKLQVTGATSSIAVGATPPTAANAGTGIWLDRTGLYSLLSNTYQVKIDATDGKLYAGAGAVTLDASGLFMNATDLNLEDPAGPTSIHFLSGSTQLGRILHSKGSFTFGYASDLWLTSLDNGAVGARILLAINTASVVLVTAAGMSCTGTITGTQLISNIAVGTKPLDVTSTTVCTNLNADTCDGQHLGTTDGPTFDHLHLTSSSTATTYGAATFSAQGPTIINSSGTANAPYGVQFGGYPGYTFGGVYGVYTSGAGNTQGDVVIAVRKASGDTYFTEALRVSSAGDVTTPGTVTAGTGAEGAVALKLNIERAWSFIQKNTGPSSRLQLKDLSGDKWFDIINNNGHTLITFNTVSTAAANGLIQCYGRLIVRTLATNPKDATPGNRPAGSVGEIGYYSGKWYGCTNAATPTWEQITSA